MRNNNYYFVLSDVCIISWLANGASITDWLIESRSKIASIYFFPFIHRHNDDNNNDPTSVFVGSHVISLSDGFFFLTLCVHFVLMMCECTSFFPERNSIICMLKLEFEYIPLVNKMHVFFFLRTLEYVRWMFVQALHLLLRVSIVIVIIRIRFDFYRDEFRVKTLYNSTCQSAVRKKRRIFILRNDDGVVTKIQLCCMCQRIFFSSQW